MAEEQRQEEAEGQTVTCLRVYLALDLGGAPPIKGEGED